MVSFTPLALLLSSALLAHATTNADFVGSGNILVVKSHDWTKASPADAVGCLNDDGRLVGTYANSTRGCGVFSRLDDFPYTVSTRKGNCTFYDASQERNVDSIYGQNDFAFHCNASYEATIYDELYTIDGFNYVWLCSGDVDCYYDAKKIPSNSLEALPLWQFHWGSQQLGITPGHVQMQLLWKKVSAPKRDIAKAIPGPRLTVEGGLQVPLTGREHVV